MTVVSNVQQCFVNLKGIETQLSILALNSRDEAAQRVFHESMITIGEIKSDLQKRILIMQSEEPQYKG
ncbi:MAG: DUF1657 domain-containing protein [Bacillota bacterium]|nr:DUF1657 domain-containing protein [Bacillota bacterium]